MHKRHLPALILWTFLLCLLLLPGLAGATQVTIDYLNRGDTVVRNGAYAGFYNATIDGEPAKVMCDDYNTYVQTGDPWTADYFTYEDILAGKGKFNFDSGLTYNQEVTNNGEPAGTIPVFTTLSGTQKYNAIGYLFGLTFGIDSADRLADINAAIWKINAQNIALTGTADALYTQAVRDYRSYTGWYDVMAILTPDPADVSQEFLVHRSVPEPATLVLLGFGLIPLARIGKRAKG